MSVMDGLERAARRSREARGELRMLDTYDSAAWLNETIAKLERAERSKLLLFLPSHFGVAISRALVVMQALRGEYSARRSLEPR